MRLPVLDLAGVPLHPVTRQGARDAVIEAVAAGRRMRHVAVNTHKLLTCRTDPALLAAVRDADLATADGIGAVLMACRLGHRVPERVTGIDLMEALMPACAERQWPIFLLGAAPGVADRVAETLRARHPGLQIAGTRHGYFPVGTEAEVAAEIARSGARMLFVALPTPRKERFVAEYADAAGVSFAMGVGGAFDVLAGRLTRAPRLCRDLGLEWAWRWAQEPRRLASRYGVGGLRFAAALLRGA